MPTSSNREIYIEFDQRIPMRDGITLSADIYRPIDSSHILRKYPVILTRTPYMKSHLRSETGGLFHLDSTAPRAVPLQAHCFGFFVR
jgi:predicted acyl esterase